MGLFDKISIPNYFSKKKTYEIAAPTYSPIIGQASTYKTLATFDLMVDKPKYTGDIPNATIKFYDDFQ